MIRPGCYQLVIRLREAVETRFGGLGFHSIPAGWVVYTGSARNGLDARIKRHKRKRKISHWHIDYLLASSGAAIAEVIEHPGENVDECALNSAVGRMTGARVVVPTFGASDCSNRCPAHLFWFKKRPPLARKRGKA